MPHAKYNSYLKSVSNVRLQSLTAHGAAPWLNLPLSIGGRQAQSSDARQPQILGL